MKKMLLCLLILFLSQIIPAEENIQTVIELQIEKEYSEWLQRMLQPYVGNNIVIIDMELQYPVIGSNMYGTQLNESETLPGLPVAKSADVAEPYDVDSKSNYTKILKKKISLFISDRISEKELTAVYRQIEIWMTINYSLGDEIIVEKSIQLRGKSYLTLYLLSALLFLIILLNIKNSTRYLGRALKRVNITGFDKVVHVKASLDNLSAGGIMGRSGIAGDLNLKPGDPVPIKLIRGKDKSLDEQIDFHFLENLSLEKFNQLLETELPEVQVYLISQLNTDYIQNYISRFPEKSNDIVKNLLKQKVLPKFQVMDTLKRIKLKYKDIKELDTYTYNGIEKLTQILNALPIDQATLIMKEIEEMDPDSLDKIRSKVFMPEDFLSLEPDLLKMLIRSLNKDVFVNYLASQTPENRSFFFKHMTERSAAIIKEDIEFLGEQSEERKTEAIRIMIDKIREILLYKKR